VAAATAGVGIAEYADDDEDDELPRNGMPDILADDVGNAGWKLDAPRGGGSSGGVGTIIGLGGRLWWTAGDDDTTGMFRGERSKTATGGDGDMAW